LLGGQAKSILKQANPLRKIKRDSLRLPKLKTVSSTPAEKKAPLIAFKGGQASYNFLYRSTIDTPYSEKDITQHILTGSLSFEAIGFIPLRVNYWLRRSNSVLFRDITDIQLQFDPAGFRNTLVENARKQWTSASSLLDDSLADKLYALKSQALKNTGDWLRSPLTAQKLREYREMLQIPSLTYDPNLPDSANKKRADSLQQQARLFLDTYKQTKGRYDSLKTQADSLEGVAKQAHARMQQYRALASSKPGDWLSYTRWQDELKKYQPSMPAVPDKYKWLMGIRSFSLGRTPVNSSELTAKNISLTGIHFEYNTWYYLSVTAGLVDYRFRDFVAGRFGSTAQYLYMARLGIGRIEKNYFIVSLSRGRKQLYASTNGSVPTSINITGVSVETRWQVHRTSYLIAEVAQSLSPDYRTQPVTNSKFSLDGGLNKALSLKWTSYFPKTHSLIEGMYKYTGANYQS
ncbi:MAG: hypothetical protein JST39_04625, partial [Bacteroidetes bacterium]|nr:hypothetical protein [Bacteroidota bacterium]